MTLFLGEDLTLVALAVLGLAVSTLFTLKFRGTVRSELRWLPAFCRLDDRTCGLLSSTHQSRLFGLPNWVLGQAYYVALLALLVFGWLSPGWVCQLVTIAAFLTFLVAVYLTYSLLFVLKIRCPLCFLAHLVNVSLFLILLIRCS